MGGGVSNKMRIIENFHSYKGTNLGYYMICESIKSDQEEKEGVLLNSNCIINLNNSITKIDKCLLRK